MWISGPSAVPGSAAHTQVSLFCVSPGLVLARTAEQETGFTLPAARDPVKFQTPSLV